MTNSVAFVLALILAAAIGADLFLNQGAGLLFLARQGVGLLEWLAFWR